ncbi:MAG: hypothetical protein J4O06_10335 [Chloroflexi bacterium]|nr:hypothetical protein [Chloroflexota bacterium]
MRATVLGRYRGYLEENGVESHSVTPTYAALRLYVDNWRWQGAPSSWWQVCGEHGSADD